jgi:hypothetical protein
MVVWSTVKELDYPNPTPGRRWYRCCRPKEKKEIRSKREACVCERRKNKNYWIVINGFFYLEMYFFRSKSFSTEVLVATQAPLFEFSEQLNKSTVQISRNLPNKT